MSPIKMIFPAVALSALMGLLTGCQHEMPKQVERPGMAAIGRPIYDKRPRRICRRWRISRMWP